MTTLGVLQSAVERLNHLLGGETELLGGVNRLRSDLGEVANALSDSESKKEVNRQVRELAYDVEDSVERFVRRQEVVEMSSSASKWTPGSALRCLLKYCSSYERSSSFGKEVVAFSRRGRALVDWMAVDPPSSSLDSRSTAAPQRVDRGLFLEPALIGMKGYEENLKELLMGERPELSVIAICGMGGIGKTTLARSAFNDAEVIEYFDIHGWSTVSHDYQARYILEGLLSLDHNNKNKIAVAAMETMELSERVYKSLKGRRYLVILDDVWSTEVWGSLRFVFPDDRNGSRIVITTRSMNVAHYTSRYQIEMKTLTDDESWQLFLIKSKLQDDPDTSSTLKEEIRKKVVKSCGGLPLAIAVIGQTLSRTSLQNWELILRGLHSVEETANDVLSLSYLDLPSQLKPCFLYMGHFPPHQPILVNKLHLLWMAEGLVSKRKEVAEDYFKELVARSLVIVEEKEHMLNPTRFISGRLHDLIRDLCISRGEQEEYFEVVDFSHPKKTRSSTCRLAVYLYEFDAILNIPDVQCIRSILFFDTVEPMPQSTWPSEVADLTNFQRMRVLDFDGVNFQVKRLPRGIEKLIYLRHLSFRGCYLQEFPSSFGNFSFLETLDLCVIDSCIMKIPNVLRKLLRLRHLYFPLAFQCDGKEKLKLGCLKNLEVVENFHAGSCDAEDLLQLENLQILTGTVDGDNLDLRNIINSINKMKSIAHSSLVVKRFDCYSKERLSIVPELLQCNGVHALNLEGHLGSLPHDIVFGLNLSEMVFNGSEFKENPMPILGKLPNLKSLVLCNDAFLGPNLVCYESDFFQLTSLKLATLQSLEEWEVKSGSMPRLTILTIEQCDKLKMLPSELAEIPTLQKLMIGLMPEKFQQGVKGIIEEAEENGIDVGISVTFYDC